MDIRPKTHLIESIRHDRQNWSVLLAEAVDNSLDAGARHVAITLSGSRVEIEDDGEGITKAREKAIVRFGDHQPMQSTALGRYGIGFKYNAVNASDRLQVESRSVDGRMRLIVDSWSRLSQSGEWEIPDPIWQPIRLTGGSTGTTIILERLRWKEPRERELRRARDELTRMFNPALLAGVEISLNDGHLQPLQEPELSDLVDHTIQLAKGKAAHVRAGYLIKPGPVHHVDVSYRHRVIEAESGFACDGYSGLTRLFARIELSGPWVLSRFKDELQDDDREELENTVLELLRPILEKCQSAQMNLNVEEMTDLLNEMLPLEVQNARPKRKEATQQRPKKKSRRQKQHGDTKEGTPDSHGPTRQAQSPQKVVIAFEDQSSEKYGYGQVKGGRPDRIELARDNPDIQRWLAFRDREQGKLALFAIAIMLYEHFKETTQRQMTFEFANEPFGRRVWLSRQRQPIDFENRAEA